MYWITRNTYSGDDGVLRSYDLATGAVTEVDSGIMRDVRATPMGIAWWSRGTGPGEVTIGKLFDGNVRRDLPIHVTAPFVVLDIAPRGSGATIVDTRSGAVAFADANLVDAGGGTIATQLDAPEGMSAGLVRTDVLPPLSC